MKNLLILVTSIFIFSGQFSELLASPDEAQLDRIEKDLQWIKNFHRGEFRGMIDSSIDVSCLDNMLKPNMYMSGLIKSIKACQHGDVAILKESCVIVSSEYNTECFSEALESSRKGETFTSSDRINLRETCRDWKFDCGD